MPRVPAHQVTTRNLGVAYPFIAEAGLGRRGVVIGDDLMGGSFVFDPFELYNAGVVSNPNMTGFLQDRSDDPADQLEDPAYGAPRRCRARGVPEVRVGVPKVIEYGARSVAGRSLSRRSSDRWR